MGAEVILVDSAATLAAAAQKRLAEDGLRNSQPERRGKLDYFLSDIPWKFTEVGERFLGQPITDVTNVSLDELTSSVRKEIG